MNSSLDLYVASKGGETEKVEKLLSQENIDVNWKNRTPLIWACRRGHSSVVELLLNHKDIRINEKRSLIGTALHYACECGQKKVVEELLKRNELDVNLTSTSLFEAGYNGRILIVKELLLHPKIDLEKGEDPIEGAKTDEIKVLLRNWIGTVKSCQPLGEKDFKSLCLYVRGLLIQEPNIVPIKSPVTVCGDVHGQFHDLLKIFSVGGFLPDTQYLFLGDYVDRGYHSTETLTYLLLMKAKYPQRIFLLRGNHECRQISTVYGFYDEIGRKYGNLSCFKYCTDVFDSMPFSAIIDGKILGIHGGLSPSVKTLDQIQIVNRDLELPNEGPLSDFAWSDPDDDTITWDPSPRGAGYLFGSKVTKEFNELNSLKLICRAHQLVMEGYKYHHENKLVTIWSAPNYCYRLGNPGSIIEIDEKHDQKPITFEQAEEDLKTSILIQKEKPQYFL